MLPRLIHPIPIVIERISTAKTVYDEDYREPVQNTARLAPVTCPGQVAWNSDKAERPTELGPEEGSDGYVLFRRCDLRALGVATIVRGDRFTKFGAGANEIDVDVYVTRVKYEGHYPDQGGATLLKAFFRDRQPSAQNR